MNKVVRLIALSVGLAILVGCDSRESSEKSDGAGGLSGDVKVDGSSTVAPITTVAAEMFRDAKPKVRVTVGISGTGGGFKKFLDPNPTLRTDINDASRPIKSPEMEQAGKLGIEFIELPIALDGISIVVNPKNNFCDHLTVAELKRMWEPGSKINSWKDVRAGFPDVPLKLYGPGMDSGTFDYFTEAINGKEKACRSDFNPSEDDNVLVQGVNGDRGGLGYFGFSYYEENMDKLKLLAIDNGNGKPTKPSMDTIRDGSYKPLARPLFLYVNKTSSQKPAVAAFLDFYLTNVKSIVEHPKVRYVVLPDDIYAATRKRLSDGASGSAFARLSSASQPTLTQLYLGK